MNGRAKTALAAPTRQVRAAHHGNFNGFNQFAFTALRSLDNLLTNPLNFTEAPLRAEQMIRRLRGRRERVVADRGRLSRLDY